MRNTSSETLLVVQLCMLGDSWVFLEAQFELGAGFLRAIFRPLKSETNKHTANSRPPFHNHYWIYYYCHNYYYHHYYYCCYYRTWLVRRAPVAWPWHAAGGRQATPPRGGMLQALGARSDVCGLEAPPLGPRDPGARGAASPARSAPEAGKEVDEDRAHAVDAPSFVSCPLSP